MFNMIRGDFYRLKHSKGFYITEFILIALVLSSVLTGTLGTIGARSDSIEEFQQAGGAWNAVKATKLMTSMCSFLIYLILPLFIMTTGFEFSRRSYKNPLSSGMTRLNYYLSKYSVFIVIVLLQVILYYGTVYVVTGIKNGFGIFTLNFGIKMAQAILLQLLLLLAIFSVSILVLFITFSTISAVVTTIIFPLLVNILHMIFIKVAWLKYFDFQGTIDSAYFTHFQPKI
ncbi:hypothetical protein AYR56_11065 [Loigolactobacillus backii]|uniref:Uncharacterized protein n=1 Tax=Loigolactobacillus backii TaxID=375175 RepID=A0A192H0N7_9LACO|nr:ABC transporter permease [Loigolactobacillus backii]ANK62359.1 hypothetical protein AYR53_05925 [Loigolactobacillus backii]ANK70629.1 hypothetical protein AYR56_11065 [Loigolactobacillus backii]